VKTHTISLEQLLNLPALSRRRDVRIEPTETLHVAIPAAKGSPAVKDISTRGVCVLADSPFTLRSVHTVTLMLGSMRVTRKARVIHCHAHMTGGWFMGMEFLEPSPNEGWTIEDLVARMLDESISFS
jgi:hypothetical protein